MIKLISFILIIKAGLEAAVVTQTEQNSIMIEAALFVVVFGTMGLISYIYSNRHAKAYKPQKVEVVEVVKKSVHERRISELEEMLKNKTLTQEEFELLNKHYQNLQLS